ncbi:hypothetical protein E2320_017148, partial [Naja naja]
NDYLVKLQAVHQLVWQQLDKAKVDYKKVTDQSWHDTTALAMVDLASSIGLSCQEIGPPVQSHQYLGLFPVKAVINLVACRLTLPRLL